MPSKLKITCQPEEFYQSYAKKLKHRNENTELLSLENTNSLITFTYPVLLACLKSSSDESEPKDKSAVTLVAMIQRKMTCWIQCLLSQKHACLLLSRGRCFQLLSDEIKFSCAVFYLIIRISIYKYLHSSSIKFCLNTVTGNRELLRVN